MQAHQDQRLTAFEPKESVDPEEYAGFIGREKLDEIKRLADGVQGKSWANINSTFSGGGVAEMLQSVIPFARSVGVDAEWFTIEGDDRFFGVTKKFHNMLQGVPLEISLEEIFDAYLGTIDRNARRTLIASDMVVVHDPQPAALVMNGVIYGNTLWRCHIDTSNPNETVWRFLLPYINMCAGAIFTMPQFVGPGVSVPAYQIMPCIDPLNPKNHRFDESEARRVLRDLFDQHDIDPDRPIIAAISRYDIHKNQGVILEAFRRMRSTHRLGRPPYLIFLGNTATDDPEGGAVLARLQTECGEDPDVRFWVNVPDNDRVVGALMHIARAFVHVSTKEGFGLVVSEALWQGTPVIGSVRGGIPEQVVHERTGFTSDPRNVDIIAARMALLLENEDLAVKLGEAGREHVRANFLLPELVRRYLVLMRYLTEVDDHVPSFRMNGLSYGEIISQARRGLPHLC